MTDKKRVGIDLGTTYSAVAAPLGDDIEMIPNSNTGDPTTPSIVGKKEDEDSVTVGETARNYGQTDTGSLIETIKRHMGEEDFEAELGDETYSPEQISALILERLIDDAGSYLGTDVTNAVITVPAYFGERQRKATEAAGEIAGIDVDRIINEPTAACLAYGLHDEENRDDEEIALIYDLGGGTFDITLVELSYEIGKIEVAASNGDHHLGGKDWDLKVAQWIFEEFEADTGIDVSDDPERRQRALEEAKEAKEKLSNTESVEITMPFFGPEEGRDFQAELTRDEFEEITSELLDRTFDVCDELFDDPDVEYGVDDVDTILLVGGSTRMPAVKQQVGDYFNQEVKQTVHPDKAVAKGAAVQASIIDSNDEEIEDSGQAEKLLPGVGDKPVLLDVTPKSLGIKLKDGSFDPIIDKNTTIPTTEKKEGYSTVRDNQQTVRTEVYQGESNQAEENEFLDEFTLDGIEPEPAGEPEISIRFSLDESGLLEVEAIDEKRATAEDLTIEGAFEFDDADIDEMQSDLPDRKN